MLPEFTLESIPIEGMYSMDVGWDMYARLDSVDFREFQADSPEAALNLALTAVNRHLAHVTGMAG